MTNYKLFNPTPMYDSWIWNFESSDNIEDNWNVFLLFNGGGLAEKDGEVWLIKSPLFEDLNIKQINEIYEAHGIQFWADTKYKYITPYEVNVNFGKLDRKLFNSMSDKTNNKLILLESILKLTNDK